MASAARKPVSDPFADFAGEENIHLITDDDDSLGPPVNFQGDVMKAKTTQFNIQSVPKSGKFNYK